jgi:hypothetical protein
VKFEIVEEQLKLLYDSMQNLFKSKNKQDEIQTEILFVKKQMQDLKFERDKFQQDYAAAIMQQDKLNEDVKF